jgi:hypothetical protein
MVFLAKIYKKFITLFRAPAIDAALAWQAGEGEAKHDFWMFATPVNMLLGRDSFFLTDPSSTTIANEESVALIDSLNAHYSGMGYHFYLINDVWFLGLDNHPNITTTPIDQVKNKDIANYLPQGDGALAWNKLQNEVQMLLFNHPVNQAREAQGLPIINSLWCYGLGAS